MRAAHSAFTLSAVPVSVGIIGAAGRVGLALIRQVCDYNEQLTSKLINVLSRNEKNQKRMSIVI